MEHYFFEIEVIESKGPLGRVGSPVLFCRAAGQRTQGQISILNYDDFQHKWIEYKKEIDLDRIGEIIRYLNQSGIPERLPDVWGLQATAPFWISSSIKIKFDEKRFYLDIWTEHGISGKDEKPFRDLFGCLFNLVGFPGPSSLLNKG